MAASMMTITRAPQIEETHSSPQTKDIERELVALHNADLRYFASEMPVKVHDPSLTEIHRATPSTLQRLLDPDFNSELAQDALGIVVITDFGGRGANAVRASWSVATSDDWAQEQLELYSQPEYQALRKALNIDHHWIFQIHPNDKWLYDDDYLINGHITYDQDGSPECWIFDLTPYQDYDE